MGKKPQKRRPVKKAGQKFGVAQGSLSRLRQRASNLSSNSKYGTSRNGKKKKKLVLPSVRREILENNAKKIGERKNVKRGNKGGKMSKKKRGKAGKKKRGNKEGKNNLKKVLAHFKKRSNTMKRAAAAAAGGELEMDVSETEGEDVYPKQVPFIVSGLIYLYLQL
jgi:hypothetical protein